MLIGKPDVMRNVAGDAHFAGDDRLANFVAQEDKVSEIWLYRNHPRLPPTPTEYSFQFNPACEAVGNPSAQRLLDNVAKSYVVR